jgi:hypothetical protein
MRAVEGCLLLGGATAGGLGSDAGEDRTIGAVRLALAFRVERIAAAVAGVGVQVVGALLAHDVLLGGSGWERLFRPHETSMPEEAVHRNPWTGFSLTGVEVVVLLLLSGCACWCSPFGCSPFPLWLSGLSSVCGQASEARLLDVLL